MEINLEEILEKHREIRPWRFSIDLKYDILNAMREACNQCIDACAENANVTFDGFDNFINGKETIIVNKQSILKVKEIIK